MCFYRRCLRVVAVGCLLEALLLAQVQASALATARSLAQAHVAAGVRELTAEKAAPAVHKMSLHWDLVPGAVRYQFVLLAGRDFSAGVVWADDYVFDDGYELELADFGTEAINYYWAVCPLDYAGNAIGSFSQPQPVSAGKADATSPVPETEFMQMAYAPLYPVFSWRPFARAESYEIQVWRGQEILSTAATSDTSYYEEAGYTEPGIYHWRVRAVFGSGEAVSSWSEPAYFEVTAPVEVAALGDSITHGGGVISVPPGRIMYNWETYCQIPVKNLGLSGNETKDMLDRFEQDVLPFAPQILIIMGGVNDYRAGVSPCLTIKNLAAIRDKCLSYGIVPVFATATPINPLLMAGTDYIAAADESWQEAQALINRWIMEQPYAIDVTSRLTDRQGCLRADWTTDGLHPDKAGKEYIGQSIGAYLEEHFPYLQAK